MHTSTFSPDAHKTVGDLKSEIFDLHNQDVSLLKQGGEASLPNETELRELLPPEPGNGGAPLTLTAMPSPPHLVDACLAGTPPPKGTELMWTTSEGHTLPVLFDKCVERQGLLGIQFDSAYHRDPEAYID